MNAPWKRKICPTDGLTSYEDSETERTFSILFVGNILDLYFIPLEEKQLMGTSINHLEKVRLLITLRRSRAELNLFELCRDVATSRRNTVQAEGAVP